MDKRADVSTGFTLSFGGGRVAGGAAVSLVEVSAMAPGSLAGKGGGPLKDLGESAELAWKRRDSAMPGMAIIGAGV